MTDVEKGLALGAFIFIVLALFTIAKQLEKIEHLLKVLLHGTRRDFGDHPEDDFL